MEGVPGELPQCQLAECLGLAVSTATNIGVLAYSSPAQGLDDRQRRLWRASTDRARHGLPFLRLNFRCLPRYTLLAGGIVRKTELTLLFYALLAGLLLGGILSGFTSIGLLSGLAIASIAYALSCIVRLRKVFAWLRQDEEGEPPESIGEWGELLDELHRLRRGYAKCQQLFTFQLVFTL